VTERIVPSRSPDWVTLLLWGDWSFPNSVSLNGAWPSEERL
jgi:hypothetical protein